MAFFCTPLGAIETRDGDTTDNARFSGFPSNPVAEPSFIHATHDLTGVGWQESDTRKQFALVSPRHFVGANHFRPGIGATINFLGSDGQVSSFTVSEQQAVKNTSNQDTDLFVGTFSSPVDDALISPVPYLNLASEATYTALPMLIFGRTVLGANSTADSIIDFAGLSITGNASLNNTRMISFVYNNSVGMINDGNFQSGDSGSPAFAVLNGKAGLVGTNSAIIPTLLAQTNLCAFVPFYQGEVNAIMDDEGYRLIKHTSLATTVTLSLSPSATLRQGYPGQITLSLENTGVAEAENVSVTTKLAASGHLPDNLSGAGWFGGHETMTARESHRSSITSGANSTLTLSWNELPAAGELGVTVRWQWDGGTVQNTETNYTLLPSYRAWSAGLSDASFTDDPDSDGVNNLLEYAFGGDPETNATTTPGGDELTPETARGAATERVELRYRQRLDASARALTYRPEFSVTLPGSWTSELPTGSIVSSQSAADSGFEIVVISVPMDAAPLFFQVAVELNE